MKRLKAEFVSSGFHAIVVNDQCFWASPLLRHERVWQVGRLGTVEMLSHDAPF